MKYSSGDGFLVCSSRFYGALKVVGSVCMLLAATSGCSSSRVTTPAVSMFVEPEDESVPLPEEASEVEPIPVETCFSYYQRIATLLTALWPGGESHNQASTSLQAKSTPLSEFDREELVDSLTNLLHEPTLNDDPLIANNCADSAAAWCDPQYEAQFLTYLEREKDQHAQINDPAIFPNFISPVENGLVLRGMQPAKKKRRGHYGVDLVTAGKNRKGVPMKAVEDGVVITDATGRGYGYYVVLYHKNGIFSLYSHLLKENRVKVGQHVKRGETIAYMGKSGNARGYHLHFELIDLREAWNLRDDIDKFVQKIALGKLAKCENGAFSKLLFSRKYKKDPLQSLPGLAYAVWSRGVPVAGAPITIRPTTAKR